MAKVQIFWDPRGFELNSIGKTTINGPPTDGDTPYVRSSLRMLSIDTAEVHYPGNSNPANHDGKLTDLATWIQAGGARINADLSAYLVPKLATGTAGTLQKSQGDAAKAHFQTLLNQKPTRPNGSNDKYSSEQLMSPLTSMVGCSYTWPHTIQQRNWGR